MKRATVLALLADRDRATAERLAALQRLDDTTTDGLTVRRLLDGLAAAHGPASEPMAPLVWHKGEAVPEWLVEGAQVRILECAGTASHRRRKGNLTQIDGDGDGNVDLGDVTCLTATALELVAPVPAPTDPDDDAAEWKRRALDAEGRIAGSDVRIRDLTTHRDLLHARALAAETRIDMALSAHDHVKDVVEALRAVEQALRGES